MEDTRFSFLENGNFTENEIGQYKNEIHEINNYVLESFDAYLKEKLTWPYTIMILFPIIIIFRIVSAFIHKGKYEREEDGDR